MTLWIPVVGCAFQGSIKDFKSLKTIEYFHDYRNRLVAFSIIPDLDKGTGEIYDGTNQDGNLNRCVIQ